MEQQFQINDNSNFLETSVVAEIFQKLNQIETNCKGKIGEDIVTERIKQVVYAKILCNVYQKDISYLIKAYSSLGISYYDINYYPQAEEHLLNAFKLNENISKEDGKEMKEQQIKILINLAKCYLENSKESKALLIGEESLKMNKQIHNDDNHISNGDIYYIISKAHTKLGNYQAAIDNLNEMYEIYEKIEGSNCEKTAKILLEIAQVYELWKMYQNAIDFYNKSFQIWEQIITNNDYEVLFQISIKLAGLYGIIKNEEQAYTILCKTDNDYGNKTERTTKNKFIYQKKRIKYCMHLDNNKELYLEEFLRLERILTETNENPNALAKTCLSIAVIYLDDKNKEKCMEYYNKAYEIYEINGNNKRAEEIKDKIIELQKERNDNKENKQENNSDNGSENESYNIQGNH